jgi:hypothetical protein
VSLKEQGFRFVLRPLDGRIEGRWIHPSEVKPEWLDCTDMEDDVFVSNVDAMQLWLERRRDL